MRWIGWAQELRRRRVFRGVGAYIVIAWLLAMFVAPAIPHGLRLFTYSLLALGAPLAGLFSWLFRVRPGELELEDHHDGSPPATALSRALDVMVIAGLAMVVVGSVVFALSPSRPDPTPREQVSSPLYVTPQQ